MKTTLYHFDEFFEDVWDYISDKIVSDNYWEQNQEFIREISYNVYRYEINKIEEQELSQERKLVIAYQTAVKMEIFLDHIINNADLYTLGLGDGDLIKYTEFIIIPNDKLKSNVRAKNSKINS